MNNFLIVDTWSFQGPASSSGVKCGSFISPAGCGVSFMFRFFAECGTLNDSGCYGCVMVTPQWDQAGFTDEQTGRLGRTVPSGHICVPGSIDIEGPFLIWQYEGAKSYRPTGEILNRFVRLWKGTLADEGMRTMASPSDPTAAAEAKWLADQKALEARSSAAANGTLRFARQYGVLGLRGDRSLSFDFDLQGAELLEDWWTLSRKACAFLNIAAALNYGRHGESRDWQLVDLSAGPVRLGNASAETPSAPHRITEARQRFQWAFEEWLALARITLGLVSSTASKFRWRTEIDYHGRLFSAIVLQLLLTVVQADSLYLCSGCGLPYGRPKEWKKPNQGEANFCIECGPQAALRQADQRRREKMAAARRLKAEGISTKEIAHRLETTPASVLRWLKKGKQN
jgi:hypothetical protein